MKTAGMVQVLVDGEPVEGVVNMAAGDSLLFTMPGKLVNGKVAIAEERITSLENQVRGWGMRVAKLEQAIRDIAGAASLDEAIGIAWRSGALHEDDY